MLSTIYFYIATPLCDIMEVEQMRRSFPFKFFFKNKIKISLTYALLKNNNFKGGGDGRVSKR